MSYRYSSRFAKYRAKKDEEHYRKLFVGGLSYETTKEELSNYFGEFGTIVDSVVMLYPDTKRSRGFGFVTFDNEESIDSVQDSRPHHIDGKEIETKRATPREDTSRESQLTVNKIFVGGVPEEATEDDIRSGCQEHGNATRVEIMKHHDSGKPRGFIFVTFDDYDIVDKICMKGFVEILGKKCDVKKAIPKFSDAPERGRGRGGRGGRSSFGQGRGDDRYGYSRSRNDFDRNYRSRSRSPVKYDRYGSRGGRGDYDNSGGYSSSSYSSGGGAPNQTADVLSNLSNVAPALNALGSLMNILSSANAQQPPPAPAAPAPNPLNQLMSVLGAASGGGGFGGGQDDYRR